MANRLPDRARVVIIGGGIVGCSIAYHLTKLGWKDVVVLERHEVTSGTTWHAAGLVTQFRTTKTLIEIAKYGVELYGTLEDETGLPTGFRQSGSIAVAGSKGRADELKRIMSMSRAFGVEMAEISLREAADKWPLLNTDGLEGALFIPGDGQCLPDKTTLAMAEGARRGGATIIEHVRVTGVDTLGGAVTGVRTDQGNVECEVVVNCGGMWAREIGALCGVSVPLHAAEHMYLITNPMGIPRDMPSLRDPDSQIYFRRDKEEEGAMLMGGFESVAKPWGMDGIPKDYNFALLDPDWDHFKVFWEHAIRRAPAMEEAGIDRFYVSAESFTPDNRYLMGESPEVRNFWVAAGMNSTGIAGAAGVGRAMAEWIAQGYPSMDLAEVDIRRFHRFNNGSRFLHDRTVEAVGLIYGMHWPHLQPETARPVRRSPLHDRLTLQGACFGVSAGWERPYWFAPEGVEPRYGYSFRRQNWFPYSCQEHKAVRERVGLFDQTSFAKFLMQGRDSEAVLQRLCSNDVGVPNGRVVYTAMLNERGGIETDLTITRLAEDRFLIVTSGGSGTRDFDWITRNTPEGAHAVLTDVTSAYAVLGVMGPQSRQLLSHVTGADLSNDAFPFMSSREIEVGYALVRATRITYVGELGWEIYIPTEFALSVYDSIRGAGRRVGLGNAGFHAMDSLRLERGYRAWGSDITDQETPIEAGLGFAVAFEKDADFIGREALLRQRETGVSKRLTIFTLDDPEPVLLGEEPIYRDGELIGRTSSGTFGHTLGRSVGIAHVHAPGRSRVTTKYLRSGSYEIEVLSERVPATLHLRPPYDPKGVRVRA